MQFRRQVCIIYIFSSLTWSVIILSDVILQWILKLITWLKVRCTRPCEHSWSHKGSLLYRQFWIGLEVDLFKLSLFIKPYNNMQVAVYRIIFDNSNWGASQEFGYTRQGWSWIFKYTCVYAQDFWDLCRDSDGLVGSYASLVSFEQL